MQSNTEWNRLTTLAKMATEKLVSPGAARLTEKILGWNSEELVEILHELAFELNLSHIAVLSLATNKSSGYQCTHLDKHVPKGMADALFSEAIWRTRPRREAGKRGGSSVRLGGSRNRRAGPSTILCRRYSPWHRMPRTINSRPKSKDHTLACLIHKRHASPGLGELQIVEHAIPSAIVCFNQFRCEHRRKAA